MKKVLIFIAVGIGMLYWYTHREQAYGLGSNTPHNEVIMYSLTTCGYCKQKARELRADAIEFTEYFIDRDSSKRQELSTKMANAGYTGGNYPVPILDVHGVMLPGNPTLDTIRRYLYQRHGD